MRLLRRYLFFPLLSSLSSIWLLLLALFLLVELLQQAESVDNSWNWMRIGIYLLLQAPAAAVETLPYAVLLGCLLRLGTLMQSGEIAALRSVGLSPIQIFRLSLRPILLLCLLSLLLAQFVAPQSSRRAEMLRDQARGDSAVQSLWYREGNDYLYFQASLYKNILRNVAVYSRGDDHALHSVTYAARAEYREPEQRWLLHDVQEIYLLGDPSAALGAETVRQNRQPQRFWDGALHPQALHRLLIPPEQLSLSQRIHHANWLNQIGMDSHSYRLGFWRVLLQPLAALALAILGMALLFGSLRGESSGTRVAVGMLLGLLFVFLSNTVHSAALAYSFSPFGAVLLPPLLLLLWGLVLLRRS